ncbi:MAG: hypothetical protein R3B92_04670 [Patescibacteria group bacterium]
MNTLNATQNLLKVTCYNTNMYTHRTNLLLTKQEHTELKRLATENNKSIGQVIREAIEHTYNISKPLKRKDIVLNTKALTKGINLTNKEITEFKEYGRK